MSLLRIKDNNKTTKLPKVLQINKTTRNSLVQKNYKIYTDGNIRNDKDNVRQRKPARQISRYNDRHDVHEDDDDNDDGDDNDDENDNDILTIPEGSTESTTAAAITDDNEDALLSLETLRESPVQWPEKCKIKSKNNNNLKRIPGMSDFLTMSDTPIHMPHIVTYNGLTNEELNEINELRTLTPEQLAARINSLHDEIYQLGLTEAREMTRGKLLGIFRCNNNKRK